MPRFSLGFGVGPLRVNQRIGVPRVGRSSGKQMSYGEAWTGLMDTPLWLWLYLVEFWSGLLGVLTWLGVRGDRSPDPDSLAMLGYCVFFFGGALAIHLFYGLCLYIAYRRRNAKEVRQHLCPHPKDVRVMRDVRTSQKWVDRFEFCGSCGRLLSSDPVESLKPRGRLSTAIRPLSVEEIKAMERRP